MRTKFLGLLTGLALLGGGAALAEDPSKQTPPPQSSGSSDVQSPGTAGELDPMQSPPGTGGSGQTGTEDPGASTSPEPQSDQGVGGAGQSGTTNQPGMGTTGQQQGNTGNTQGATGTATGTTAQAGNELTGTVAKADKKNVFVKDDSGAIIPVKVTAQTRFEDPNLKSAKDLKADQQVRISFETRGTENLAKSITMDTGAATGGSGEAGGDSGLNQPPTFPDMDGPAREPLPPDQSGTGGSGLPDANPYEDPSGTGLDDPNEPGSLGGSGDLGSDTGSEDSRVGDTGQTDSSSVPPQKGF